MKIILTIAALALLLPFNLSAPANAFVPKGKISKPEVAAKRLYDAWKRHDRPAALRVASRSVVNKLFKNRSDKGAPDWQFTECGKRRGGYDCFYSFEGSGTSMRVTGSRAASYRVTSIKFIAD